MTDPQTTGTPRLNAALAAFQSEMPTLERDRDVEVETKDPKKPNYNYSYATLANVTQHAMPLLGKHGLSFTTFPGTGSDGKMALRYSLLHESGEERSGEFPLSGEGGIQILGGRITYIRRYCLLAVTGLAAEEDDDAAAAQAEDEANKGTVQRRTQPKPRPRPQTEPPAEEGTAVQRRPRTVAEPPPLPGEETVDPDAVSEPQQRKLAIQFRELEVTDRDHRLALMTDMLGRPITSIKDLSKREASAAIDAIDKALKDEHPLTAMIEIYRRTQGDEATRPPMRDDGQAWGPDGGPHPDVPRSRPPGRSRTARDAVTSGGEGTEAAPWEQEEGPR